MVKKSITVVVLVGLAAAGAWGFLSDSHNETARTDTSTSTLPNQTATLGEADKQPEFSIDEPSSPWVVVNKSRPLPKDYEPSDLTAPNVSLRQVATEPNMQLRDEAASKLESLFLSASQAGHQLMVGSAYRSYDTQAATYNSYVQSIGAAAANKISAKPGTSEHQTGWAVDVAAADWNCYLETCFGATAEGKWLATNAYEHGFIIRYPKGKTNITGYSYEPWHLRYVGANLADKLHKSGQTLEEYFKL